MTTYTNLEKIVFNAVLDLTFYEYCATTEDIANKTGLEVNTVKGVQGSLVKKSKLVCEDRKVWGVGTLQDCFPVINSQIVSFGCDDYEETDWNNYKL